MQLIYLSPVPWLSFSQRPHRFVEWFFERFGTQILWVDPYPTRFPQWNDLKNNKVRCKIDKINQNIPMPKWISVIHPKMIPIEPLPGAELFYGYFFKSIIKTINAFIKQDSCFLVIGKPSKFALILLSKYKHTVSYLDMMDDFSAFYSGLSRLSMKRTVQDVAKQVSKIFVSSRKLADLISPYNKNIAFVPNACAVDKLPSIQYRKNIKQRPILGYLGTIGKWFDWQLVYKLANANPSVKIHIIGPIYSQPPIHKPENIQLIDACDHNTGIQLMQKFAVGLIPFLCNDLTASVDPIKFYEYRSLGLPVLSTDFGEMAYRKETDGVIHLTKSKDMVKPVQRAIKLRSSILEIESFRKQNSWHSRFDSIDDFQNNIYRQAFID